MDGSQSAILFQLWSHGSTFCQAALVTHAVMWWQILRTESRYHNKLYSAPSCMNSDVKNFVSTGSEVSTNLLFFLLRTAQFQLFGGYVFFFPSIHEKFSFWLWKNYLILRKEPFMKLAYWNWCPQKRFSRYTGVFLSPLAIVCVMEMLKGAKTSSARSFLNFCLTDRATSHNPEVTVHDKINS